MKKYLVITKPIYIDGHGDYTFENPKKEVKQGKDIEESYTTFIVKLDEDDEPVNTDEMYFDGDYWESYPEEGNLDGYLTKIDEVTIKELTEEEAIKYSKIIKDYNEIKYSKRLLGNRYKKN